MIVWKLNNILLKNQWVKQEIKEKIRKYLHINENEDTTYQKLQITAKGYTEEEEILQINHLTFHFKTLQKKGQTNPKARIRKDTVKIRTEMNEIENLKIQKNQ